MLSYTHPQHLSIRRIHAVLHANDSFFLEYVLKIFAFVCILCCLVIDGKTQVAAAPFEREGSLYYYFGAQKIMLSESRTHILVETKDAAQTVAIQSDIKSIQLLSGVQLQTLAVPTRGVITLSNASNFEATMNWLQQQPGVLVVRPAVYQQQKKDNL